MLPVTVILVGDNSPNAVTVTASTPIFNVPTNAQGYPTMIDISTDDEIGTSINGYAWKNTTTVRITDGSGTILKQFASSAYRDDPRRRFLISSCPAVIRVDYQFYSVASSTDIGLSPGSTLTLTNFTASATTVKR